MRIAHPAAFALALLTACEPATRDPVSVEVVAFDPTRLHYTLQPEELTTVQDLTTLQGPVAQLVGGARIVIDASDPAVQAAQTDAQLRAAILKNPGGDVRASYLDVKGVEWPTDFDSENLATTYYNFETSFAFFHALGLTQAQVGTPPVYYRVAFVDPANGSDEAVTDNMAYYSIVGGFLLLPFDQLQQLPLPMNLGLVGHEYSHFQLNARVYGGAAQPSIFTTWGVTSMVGTGPTPAANLLRSLDEGFADFFGTGVTCGAAFNHCDPDFIAQSISAEADARSLSGVHCLDASLGSALAQDDFVTFTGASLQYPVGTVLSSALWRAATDPTVVDAFGRSQSIELAMQTLYDSLDDPRSQTGLAQLVAQDASAPALFTIDYAVASSIVSEVVPGSPFGVALCNAFFDRLGSGQCAGLGPVDGAALPCIPACANFPEAQAPGYAECP